MNKPETMLENHTSFEVSKKLNKLNLPLSCSGKAYNEEGEMVDYDFDSKLKTYQAYDTIELLGLLPQSIMYVFDNNKGENYIETIEYRIAINYMGEGRYAVEYNSDETSEEGPMGTIIGDSLPDALALAVIERGGFDTYRL